MPLLLMGQNLLPPIYNYPIVEYNAASQNWGVSVNDEGELFVANSKGLLYYNGEQWSLNKLPNNTIIRSVACIKDKIYTGSYEEFGYWKKNDKGFLFYTSLTHLIVDHSFTNEEFWQILTFKDQIIFHSFSRAYIYENNTVKVLNPHFTITGLAVYQDKLILSSNVDGLFWIKDDKAIPLPEQEIVMGKTITEIVPTKYGLFIGTKLSGLYIYRDGKIVPLSGNLNEELKHEQLNKILQLSSGKIAFGTIKNGVYLYDPANKTYKNYNRETGLQNNTVLSMEEFENQLWVGLDNGLDRIQLDSPISYYTDYSGVVGTVYDIAVFQNNVFLGSNTGVYSVNDSGLHFIQGSQGHVWDLDIVDDELFCGHNTGTYKIFEDKIEQVSGTSGGYVLVNIPERRHTFLQGTYIGLSKYRLADDGEWEVSMVSGLDFPVKQLCFEDPNTIWVAHPYKGFYRLKLDAEYDKVIAKQEYQGGELTNNYNVNLFNIKNQIVFNSEGKWFKYDPILDKIIRFKEFDGYRNKDLIYYDDAHFWFMDTENTKEIVITNLKNDSLVITETALKRRVVPDAQNIISLNDSIYLFTLSDGYGKINLAQLKRNLRYFNSPVPKLRHFRDEIHQFSITDANTVQEIKFKDAQNILIDVSSPSIIHPRYYYELKGTKEETSYLDTGSINFQNLPHGAYSLEVSTVSMDNKKSLPLVIHFAIAPPWYLSKLSIAFYLIALVILFLLVRRYNRIKLERKHNKLKERLQREQEEKLAQMENEKLAKEIKSKQKELTGTTMNMVKKNELILELKNMLIVNKEKFSNQQSRYRTFMTKLNNSIHNDDDWKRFEVNFKELHSDFFENLLKKYPTLTPKDLKLCAYLKMNLSSKEIAPLMGITTRGVEIHRYRLRKRLEISSSQNISNFLITFS